MSIIAPNSDITLYSNVPISDVKNIVFPSPTAQANYFASKVYRTAVECTYERVGDPLILEIPIEDMYEFNYISFKNKSFENKTIYARALQPVYVNNEVMAVPYVVDDWQTFMFDITMDKCNIVRESLNKHDKDALSSEGKKMFSHHILPMFTPEPLAFGESIRANRTNGDCFFFPVMMGAPWGRQGANGSYYTPVICVITSQTKDSVDPEKIVTEQATYDVKTKFPLLTKKNCFALSPSGLTALKKFIDDYTAAGMVSSIIGMYYVPAVIADTIITGDNQSEPAPSNEKQTIQINISVDSVNPKLINYPYSFLRVTDYKGNSKEYRLDRFDGTFNGSNYQIEFGAWFTFNGYAQVFLAPKNYLGFNPTPARLDEAEKYNFDEGMIITDFPQIAYNTDGFLTWLGGVYNQQTLKDISAAPWSYNEIMDILGAGLQGSGQIIGESAKMNPVGGVANGLMGIGQNVFERQVERGIHGAAEQYQQNKLTGVVPITTELSKAIPAFVQDNYHPSQQSCGLPAVQFDRFGFIFELIRPMNCIYDQYQNYFDKYGYSNSAVKVPSVYAYTQNANDDNACTFNTDNETFVKTQNCCVTAPNATVSTNIEQMFNNGHWFIKGDS